MENAMGFSIPELLSKMSLLIVNHSLVETYGFQLNNFIRSSDFRFIRRWRRAKQLPRMTGSDLIRNFLSSLIGPKYDILENVSEDFGIEQFQIEQFQIEHRVGFLAGMREGDPSRSGLVLERCIHNTATSA
jgi:hypothetical protein